MLCWGAVSVQAQMVLPRTIPLAPRVLDPRLAAPTYTYVPMNPAVIQFTELKFAGFATIRAANEEKVVNPGTAEEFAGWSAGGIMGSPRLSMAFEITRLFDDKNSLKTVDWTTQGAALQLTVFENLRIGLGITRTNSEVEANPVSSSTSEAGGVVSFPGGLFFGFSQGNEVISSLLNGEQKRPVRKIGVGHVLVSRFTLLSEIYIETRPSPFGLLDGAGAAIPEFSEVKRRGLALEWLVKYLVFSARYDILSLTDTGEKTKGIMLAAGGGMNKGFLLTLQWENMHSSHAGTGATFQTKATTVALAKMF